MPGYTYRGTIRDAHLPWPTTPGPRCGEYAGYSRHRRRKEDPCDACRAANVTAYQEWKARKQEGA